MNEIYFRQLLDDYVTGKLSEQDQRKFFEFLEQDGYRNVLEEVLRKEWDDENYMEQTNTQIGERIEQYVLRRIANNEKAPVRPISFFRRYRMIAAAVIIIIAGAGLYLLLTNRTNDRRDIAKTIQNDVPPGSNKAVLTLADGSTIILDSAADGQLAQQGNAKISKTNEGQLAYNLINEKPTTEVLYNTLATPRGGQYRLVLPDESKVWLNAASSIRYPTVFTGKERVVEITGEAYFEVEKNEKLPFIVKIISPSGDNGEVRVLGTHFNINAYDDESLVRTTLLEGSVLIKKDAAMALLKPGEQAQLNNGSSVKVVKNVDLEEVVAWKNREFNFNGADIYAVMRQLSRWYDVDVIYQNKKIDVQFFFEIPRSSKLSDVLRILELAGKIKFQIEGKRVIVLP
ncbi:FecR family protein [Terrimonas pollutisoli]|uniref:FecR family protein n=1 Tax=Terrimonas pollutisoli TaxID=3034147 RepID=UPI0023EAF62B|nr:FecR family protein [Terrimonas sp. H1YJ31]